MLFSSGSPVAAFAKQQHAPTQRKMMMRQKKGETKQAQGRWRCLSSGRRENESHQSFLCTFTTCMFLLGEHSVCVSASASFSLLSSFGAFPLLPPQVIKSPLATSSSSSVFCSSPSAPLRPPTSLSCAAKWTAYITPRTWRGFSYPATSSFPSSCFHSCATLSSSSGVIFPAFFCFLEQTVLLL